MCFAFRGSVVADATRTPILQDRLRRQRRRLLHPGRKAHQAGNMGLPRLKVSRGGGDGMNRLNLIVLTLDHVAGYYLAKRPEWQERQV